MLEGERRGGGGKLGTALSISTISSLAWLNRVKMVISTETEVGSGA